MRPAKSPNAETSALYRLGAWCAGHAWRVVAVWLVVLVGAGILVPKFTDSLTGSSLSVSGSDSARAEKLLAEKFDSPVTEDVVVVFDTASHTVDDPVFRSVVSNSLAELRRQDGVVRVEDPYGANAESQISADRRTAVAPTGLSGDERSRQDVVPELQGILDKTAGNGVRVYLTGSSPLNAAVVEQEDKDLARAESIGLPIALVVLTLAFGTLVAASLPLLLGVAALVTAFGALGAASYFASFDVFVQAVVTMLGLALGIDYSLFIVTRQREELARRGHDSRVEAVAATMATAGKAVLFSGSTVLISVAGLLLVRAPVFQAMALGVMVAVAVMLTLALTLLPAVLALLGERINRLAIPRLRRSVRDADTNRSVWARWTRVVMRRPIAVGGAAAVALVAAALPLFGLKLGFDVGAGAVGDAPAGRGYEIVADKFAPGAATPIQIVADSPRGPLDSASLNAIDRLTDRLKGNPQVAGVVSLTDVLKEQAGRADENTLKAALADPRAEEDLERLVSSSGRTTAITVFSKSAPDSTEAVDLVRWIRDTAVPSTTGSVDGLTVVTGGLSGQIVDVADEIDRATPLVLTAVLGLSFVLLLLAFRSLLLPVSAIVMNLLSVGAAFGLLTWVFQEGAGAGVFDFTSRGFIQAYLPLLTFVVLFGLSMDYEVFLISRMKEEWGRTRNNTEAVTVGVVHTAKVITAAAAIMVVVFAAFMITRVVEVKQMGFALAVAVLVDATLIRVVLVPAVMRLAGAANWWMPGWLNRALPRVQLTEASLDMAPSPTARRPERKPAARPPQVEAVGNREDERG